MKLKIIASVKYKHIPEHFQYFSPFWMSRLFIHTLRIHRCSCESQMICGCLENAILSVMHCIIHLWVFLLCAPVENNGAFVDQKITERAVTSNRKRKKRGVALCFSPKSSQTTAWKRGGACGMKRGNAVASSGGYYTASLQSGRLKWRTHLKVEVKLVESCQMRTQSQAETRKKEIQKDARRCDTRSLMILKRSRSTGSRTLPRLAGVVWLAANDGSFPLLKRSRKEGCKHSAEFCRFVAQKMDWRLQSNIC